MYESQKQHHFKGFQTKWTEEGFFIKKVKNKSPCTYAIDKLTDEEIIETFYKKEMKSTKVQGG